MTGVLMHCKASADVLAGLSIEWAVHSLSCTFEVTFDPKVLRLLFALERP